MADQTTTPNPGTQSARIADQLEPVQICRDVYGGTLVMRSKGRAYLPQFPAEEDDAYRDRLNSAVLFNAFRRSVKGLVGMIFRKAPKLGDDVPAKIKDDAENIDNAGRHLTLFLRDAEEAAMTDGHCHILVDYPVVEVGRFQNKAAERAAKLRPYWVLIEKSAVLRAWTKTIDGEVVLVHFAYTETTLEPDGDFGEKEVERVRQYTLQDDGVQLDTWVKAKEEWVPEVEARELPIARIPVTTVYTNRTGYMTSEPPLLDLALENILHYQTRSDRQNVLHVASVPLPVLIGVDQEADVVWGPGRALKLPQGGDAKYVEPAGSALKHSRDELQDIEQRMAVLGLSMLARESRAAETAEARRIDKSETDSQLGAIAWGLQDAAEEALGFHAEWTDEADGGSLEVNRDFGELAMDPQMVKVLREMVGANELSLDTLWDILERGEILPDTFDPEVEHERLSGGDIETIRRMVEAMKAREKVEEEGEPEMEEAA